MMISKILSVLVALAYIGIALFVGAGWETLKLVGYLVLPMACTLFSEEMGDYSGMLMQGGPMTRTPGWLVAAGGWLLLLLPVGVVLYFKAYGTH
jgi:hypothetical protein